MEDCRHHQGQETPYDLKGLEMDVHHPSLDFEGNKNTLEKKVGELVNREKHFDSQFYFLMRARGTLVDGYFILERHTPGHFYKAVIEKSNLHLEKELFSSYRIG